MQYVRASRFGLLIAALTVAAVKAVAAPDPVAIMKKTQTAMLGVNSYQATMVMSMDMGQKGSMVMNMDMKMKPKQQKLTMKATQARTPTGNMALLAAMLTKTTVADGKTMWVYIPAAHGYQKAPIDKNLFNPANLASEASKIGKTKYVRIQNVNGKPAHVIQVIPDPSKTQGATGTILMYIDVATNRFRQMTMKMSGRGGPNAPGSQDTMNMSVLVKKEVVNATIPDSVFRFVPPAGAKELKAGAGGGTPGMGGMFGGSPRR